MWVYGQEVDYLRIRGSCFSLLSKIKIEWSMDMECRTSQEVKEVDDEAINAYFKVMNGTVVV